jgi:8-oxo-dGTP pyrophosphatase MutT (NUDIX family)
LSDVIRAAGGVVWRRRDGQPEVILVHRPRYDDWSFPKGKAEEGESDEDCALREVHEETGLTCTLGSSLPPVSYRSKGRPKRVRYWLMEPRAGDFSPHREVDEIAWLGLAEAGERLTYGHDRDLLAAAGELL